jgi:hypothetical protein
MPGRGSSLEKAIAKPLMADAFRLPQVMAAGPRLAPPAVPEPGKPRSASGQDRLPGSAACKTAVMRPTSAGRRWGRSIIA